MARHIWGQIALSAIAALLIAASVVAAVTAISEYRQLQQLEEQQPAVQQPPASGVRIRDAQRGTIANSNGTEMTYEQWLQNSPEWYYDATGEHPQWKRK